MLDIKPMNVRNGLKAICVIARHLDQLSPYIFAFQNTKDPKIKLGLVSKALTEIVDKETESVVAFMAYALDITTEEAGCLDFHYVLEALPIIYRVNNLETLMQAAIAFGLVEQKQGIKLWFLRK